MNELRPYPNENSPKDRMVKKGSKELNVAIYTKYTFFFDNSIIGTPRLTVLCLDQFFVG